MIIKTMARLTYHQVPRKDGVLKSFARPNISIMKYSRAEPDFPYISKNLPVGKARTCTRRNTNIKLESREKSRFSI